jgi:hypothetical protein
MSHAVPGKGTGEGIGSGETNAALMPHPSLRRVKRLILVEVTNSSKLTA